MADDINARGSARLSTYDENQALALAASVGAIDSAIPTNRIGEALFNPALAPITTPPAFPAVKRIADFGRAGHGFVGGTDDTGVFANGGQSSRVTTAGGASSLSLDKNPITSFDMSTSFLRIKLRVNDWPKLGFVGVLVGDGTNIVQQNGLLGVLSGQSISDSGEWVTVHVSKGDFPASSVNFAAVTRLLLRVQDIGGGNPVSVWFQYVDLVPNPAKGTISIVFDDGWKTQFSVAKPYMDKYGFKGGTAIIRDQISQAGGGLYMGINDLRALHDESGWDVMGHADLLASHNQANGLVDLSTTDGTATTFSSFEKELAALKGWLVANNFRGRDFLVWPLGKFTAAHLAIARKYFVGMRTFRVQHNTFEADMYPFADPLRLRQMAVTNGGSAEAASVINTAVDDAMTAGKTLILTFHGIGSSSNSWEYPTASFQSIMDNIANRTYRVKTLSEIFKEGVS